MEIFNGMKMSTKIGMGFGIVILVSAILGYVGWSGVHNVRSHMDEYALWGDIDMVMNEDVTQNALKVVNAMETYKLNHDQTSLKNLQGSLRTAEEGIKEWQGLVKDYPKLAEVASDTEEHLAMTREVVNEHTTAYETTAEIRHEWDNLIEQCVAYLETTMEKTIDPAKEAAERSKNIPEMVKWGAIDMVMNEAVIANVLKLQTTSHDYAFEPNEENWASFLAAQLAANEGLGEWRGVLLGESKMERAAAQIGEYLGSYAKLGDRYHEEVTKIQQLQHQVNSSFEGLIVALDNAMENIIDPAKEEKVGAASSAQQWAANLAATFAVSGVIIGTILAFFITRSIVKPINQVIRGLSEGADQVASASSQVTSASQSLAEGASEQAASLEETSSSLEEMSSMTKQNADNANQADNLMKDANQVVAKANNSMSEVTNSMEEISKASEETSKIIKTIDEIAFQTNLLALNAAVEAARAGEAGAGFAVVADEVRNLAMRAADAAKNTSGLIEGTVKKVKDGGELVTKTNEAFIEVAQSAGKVGELVGEIAAASNEQAQSIEQINKAVTEVDKVVQGTSANAEESASASEEMNAQAEQMREFVGELVALIEGNRTNRNDKRNGAVTDQIIAGDRVSMGTRKAISAPEKKTEIKKVTVQKAKEVIPMDDAEEFHDF